MFTIQRRSVCVAVNVVGNIRHHFKNNDSFHLLGISHLVEMPVYVPVARDFATGLVFGLCSGAAPDEFVESFCVYLLECGWTGASLRVEGKGLRFRAQFTNAPTTVPSPSHYSILFVSQAEEMRQLMTKKKNHSTPHQTQYFR